MTLCRYKRALSFAVLSLTVLLLPATPARGPDAGRHDLSKMSAVDGGAGEAGDGGRLRGESQGRHKIAANMVASAFGGNDYATLSTTFGRQSNSPAQGLAG